MPEGWQVGRQIRSGLGKAAVLGRRVAVRGRCGSVSQMWQWEPDVAVEASGKEPTAGSGVSLTPY